MFIFLNKNCLVSQIISFQWFKMDGKSNLDKLIKAHCQMYQSVIFI